MNTDIFPLSLARRGASSVKKTSVSTPEQLQRTLVATRSKPAFTCPRYRNNKASRTPRGAKHSTNPPYSQPRHSNADFGSLVLIYDYRSPRSKDCYSSGPLCGCSIKVLLVKRFRGTGNLAGRRWESSVVVNNESNRPVCVNSLYVESNNKQSFYLDRCIWHGRGNSMEA